LQLIQLCHVDANIAIKAIRDMYEKLTTGIQIEPLIPQFIASGIITQEEKEMLKKQKPLPGEKTAYILEEKIIRPLAINVKKPFEDFLLAIEQSEDVANRNLAADLKVKCEIVPSLPATGMFY